MRGVVFLIVEFEVVKLYGFRHVKEQSTVQGHMHAGCISRSENIHVSFIESFSYWRVPDHLYKWVAQKLQRVNLKGALPVRAAHQTMYQ